MIGHRATALRARLADASHEALVVDDLHNIRWLTGFTGSAATVLIGADDLVLVTDGRYGDQATMELAAAGVEAAVRVELTGAAQLAAISELAGRRQVAFDDANVSYQRYQQYSAALSHAPLPASGLIEDLRRCKDATEIDAMARACAIADRALAEVAPLLADGRSEAAVRNQLELRMRELGASGPSYDTIVASGPRNASQPHYRPKQVRIEPGQTVIIDVGALVDGYHSDMTRSFVVGEPTAQQQELYEVVLRAQVAGVAAVGPGVAAAELDAICRESINSDGYGDWFVHGTGHGVGLEIHEEPFINRTATTELRPGDVVTVEPGVYRDGFGGFRIEDLVVVTSDGARVITGSPKDSPCLPSPPTT